MHGLRSRRVLPALAAGVLALGALSASAPAAAPMPGTIAVTHAGLAIHSTASLPAKPKRTPPALSQPDAFATVAPLVLVFVPILLVLAGVAVRVARSTTGRRLLMRAHAASADDAGARAVDVPASLTGRLRGRGWNRVRRVLRRVRPARPGDRTGTPGGARAPAARTSSSLAGVHAATKGHGGATIRVIWTFVPPPGFTAARVPSRPVIDRATVGAPVDRRRPRGSPDFARRTGSASPTASLRFRIEPDRRARAPRRRRRSRPGGASHALSAAVTWPGSQRARRR